LLKADIEHEVIKIDEAEKPIEHPKKRRMARK
jgi:hypothetical protein